MDRCIRPGAVTDDDLVAYAYAEAAPAVSRHVESCPACAAAAAEYAHLQARLGRLLYRCDCPAPHTLADYHLQLLAPEERRQVAAHIRDCPACADDVQTLRRFLADQPAMPPPGPFGEIKRIVATLLTPAPGLVSVDVRGAGEAVTRTYRAADLTITIRLGAGTRRGYRRLSGVIWREGSGAETLAGQMLQLIGHDGTERTTEIEDLGDFAFDSVEPGTYRLEVALPDGIVVVEDLRLEP